jgi:diaminopimelate epimerase
MPRPVVKSHAYGNDFLLVADASLSAGDGGALARALCDRHTGIGADGLIAYRPTEAGAALRLFNADGSFAEVSGNGVRCLAAWIVAERPAGAATSVTIETDGGVKHLTLLERRGSACLFRAAMGRPDAIDRIELARRRR